MLTAAPLRQLLTMPLVQLIPTCPWIQHRHTEVKCWVKKKWLISHALNLGEVEVLTFGFGEGMKLKPP